MKNSSFGDSRAGELGFWILVRRLSALEFRLRTPIRKKWLFIKNEVHSWGSWLSKSANLHYESLSMVTIGLSRLESYIYYNDSYKDPNSTAIWPNMSLSKWSFNYKNCFFSTLMAKKFCYIINRIWIRLISISHVSQAATYALTLMILPNHRDDEPKWPTWRICSSTFLKIWQKTRVKISPWSSKRMHFRPSDNRLSRMDFIKFQNTYRTFI